MTPEENIESLRMRKTRLEQEVRMHKFNLERSEKAFTQSIKDYNIALMNHRLDQQKDTSYVITGDHA